MIDLSVAQRLLRAFIAKVYGVSQDMCMSDCDGCALETHGDWDDVIAWAAMPKYKGGVTDEQT